MTSTLTERSMAEARSRHLPWTRIDLLSCLLLCAAGALAVARFWQPGTSSQHDMLMGVYRVYELDEAWRHWILYPRLGLDLNFTYGAPLFQFYPPLASYGALIWHWAGLGLIQATKAMFTANLLLAGVGAYVYARWLFNDRRAALVSGMTYLLAPYVLAVVYERGAVAESLALALVPWVFWAFHHLLEEDKRAWLWTSAVLVALLALAHNITVLFVVPAVGVYLLLLAWRGRRLNRIVHVCLAMALGFGLSAFYWFPALAEVRYTQVESSMLSGPLSPSVNLAPLRDLVQRLLVVDYWGSSRFHLALWQAVVAGLAIMALFVQPRRLRFTMVLFAGILLVALCLQTSPSRAFWEGFPLVRYIQFPWRLLGLTCFSVAMLSGSIFLWEPLKGNLGSAVAATLLIVVGLLGVYRLDPALSPIWYHITEDQIGREDLFERGRNGFSLFSDYAPVALGVTSQELAQPRPADERVLEPLVTTPRVQVISERPTELRLQVQADHAFPLRLHRIYFPGWQAYVDNRPVVTTASAPPGLVTAEIPAGEHTVRFGFEATLLRQIALAISVLSGLILAADIARSRHRKTVLLAFLVVVGVLVILVFRYQGRGESPIRPVPYAANFQDEIQLVGWHLRRTTWKAGEVVPLRLYWLAQRTPASDYHVFVHLARLDDSGKVAQVDSLPLEGYSWPTRWEPGELVIDEQQLRLDKEVPPGVYRLLVGLYTPDTVQNLHVQQSPNVLPGDRAVLTEIEVRND